VFTGFKNFTPYEKPGVFYRFFLLIILKFLTGSHPTYWCCGVQRHHSKHNTVSTIIVKWGYILMRP